MLKYLVISALLSLPFFKIAASESVPADTLENKKGLINRVIDYFGEANVDHPERPLDISFIGGPHYSSESGFGIGLVGSGKYYTARDKNGMPDSLTPPSNVALKVDITTGQLYKVGAEGYTIFKHDQYRLNYDIYFYSFKDKFWGIGYEKDINDANETNYRRLQAQVRTDLLFQLKPNLFIGPLAQFSYINATRLARLELLEGQKPKTFTTGLGFSFVYDTRDFPLNAYKGIYVRYDQLFNPHFLGNKYAYSSSELTLCGYGEVWKNGVLASMLHANLTYGDTPWGLLPTFGGSGNMRGYYEGRFRDKNAIDITLELRQKVWRRNGIVLWVGAGSIFPKFAAFKWNQVLPNAGIGYRWEFKKRINVRLDYGVGKHQSGINFSINEAF